jgi:hypothetical protein
MGTAKPERRALPCGMLIVFMNVILFITRRIDMIRTIFTPDSKQITFPIPEKYIGTELEIIIFPLKDVSPVSAHLQKAPIFGCAKGKFKMTDDFDAPLDDFMEYMQ